jgi:hypothetical protein
LLRVVLSFFWAFWQGRKVNIISGHCNRSFGRLPCCEIAIPQHQIFQPSPSFIYDRVSFHFSKISCNDNQSIAPLAACARVSKIV